MSLQTELIIPVLVVLNPLDQFIQHGVLILWREILFRFPWAAMAVSYANVNARIQEPQLRAVGKRRLNQVAVTSLDNPTTTRPPAWKHFLKIQPATTTRPTVLLRSLTTLPATITSH